MRWSPVCSITKSELEAELQWALIVGLPENQCDVTFYFAVDK